MKLEIAINYSKMNCENGLFPLDLYDGVRVLLLHDVRARRRKDVLHYCRGPFFSFLPNANASNQRNNGNQLEGTRQRLAEEAS